MKKCFEITVYGRVQGVGFRWSAREKARQLGIKGFVKNNSNSSVFIEAEGQIDQINFYIKWCHSGPSHAEVEDVMYKEIELKDFSGFEVKY